MASQPTRGADGEWSRFSNLLQPIRDLAANWNIDLAADLEGYLEELGGLAFDFGNGKKLNFAEAALVIQGSVHVYSRKVEYLYTLVHEAKDFLSDRKTRHGKKGGATPAAAADDELWDTEEAFLTLDDVVEEAADVDLVEDPLDGQEAPGVERHRMREPPSILQMVGAGLDEGADQPPKMSTLWVHSASGALLIDELDTLRLDGNLEPLPGMPSTTDGMRLGALADRPSAAGADGQPCDAAGEARPVDIGPPCDASGMPADEGVYDDGGGMDSFWHDDGPDGPGVPESPIHGLAIGGPHGADGADGGVEGAADARAGDGPAVGHVHPSDEEQDDSWAPLDPRDASAAPAKPWRKGRASMWAKRSRPGAVAASAATQGAAWIGRGASPALAALAALVLPPHVPSKGPLFPEFAAGLAARGARGGRGRSTDAVGAEEEANGAGDELDAGDAGDGDGWAGFDVGGGADDVEFGGAEDPFPLPVTFAGDGADGSMDDVRMPWLDPATPGPPDDGTGSGVEPKTPGPTPYGRLVERYIQQLQAQAAAEHVQSQVERSVSTWRARVEPLLEDQDRRGPFDMYEDGKTLVGHLAQLTVAEDELGIAADQPGREAAVVQALRQMERPREVPLEVALQASAPWQASRGFAALLQLVNAGNVALRVAGASDGVGGVLCAAGDLSLVLLSREDRSEHFGDYRAPSVAVGNGALAPTSRLNREERLLTRGGKPAAETTGDETPKKAEEAHPPQAKRARKGQRARG